MGCSNSSLSGGRPVRLGHQAFHGKYVLGKKLGQGAFGQVRAAALRPSEQVGGPPSTGRQTQMAAQATPTHAVKILELRGGKDGTDHEQLLLEALAEDDAWRASGKHENILELMDSYVDTGVHKMAYFVMEICLGSLLDEKNRHLLGNAEEFVDIAKGMRAGLAHLHRLAIAHRDVKPENFLLGADETTVKLCDFGMASVVPKEGLKGVFGTPPYMAPEMLCNKRYRVGVDTWAYGVTCYVLLLGDFPYKPPNGIKKSSPSFKQAIKDGKQPPYTPADKTWPALLPCAQEFLKALLVRDSQKRPVLDDLERHAFFGEGPEGFASEWASERQDRGPIVTAATNLIVKKVIIQAPVDPTVQKSIDDILRNLQEEQGPRSGVAQHFSEGERLASRALNVSKRRSSRSMTHDGSLFTKKLLPQKDDDTSTVYCQSNVPTLDSLPPMDFMLSRGKNKADGAAPSLDSLPYFDFKTPDYGQMPTNDSLASFKTAGSRTAGASSQMNTKDMLPQLPMDSESSSSDSASEDEMVPGKSLLVGAALQKIAPGQKITQCKHAL